MPEFKRYRKTAESEMRPYIVGENLTNISVGEGVNIDDGGMIARDINNHDDQWFVGAKYFNENFELATKEKQLDISCVKDARVNISDLKIFGDGDLFKLLAKASSKNEGWMKSTKVLDTGAGCVIQVTTQQKNIDGTYAVAEALTFVPNVVLSGEGENRRIKPCQD